MYNNATVIEAVRQLAGLRQTDNPNFEPLASDLLYNGSNVLIQHPLLNIENLDMAARNYNFFNFPAYVSGTTYAEGDRVKYSSKVYGSLVDGNVGNQPDISPLSWEPVNLLSLYLEDVFHNSAEDTVNEVFVAKKLASQSKTLIQSMRFFDGTGILTDTIVNEGDLVGVMIKLIRKNNVLAIIEQIGLQLTQPNPAMKLYLYHSSQVEPVAMLTVNHTKTISFQWHKANFNLNYLSADYDSGGTFFIMYDQADLVGQAVRKQYDYHVAPCAYCNAGIVANFVAYSKYVYMQAVRVKAANRNPDNPIYLWDIQKTITCTGTNFGLNFQLTVKCDLTDFIVAQADVFKYAFRDMATKKLLEGIANSTRQNGGNDIAAQMARAELQGTMAGGMGFGKQVEKQLKAVDFEISSLDDLCMPCNRKGGLGYGTAMISGGR